MAALGISANAQQKVFIGDSFVRDADWAALCEGAKGYGRDLGILQNAPLDTVEARCRAIVAEAKAAEPGAELAVVSVQPYYIHHTAVTDIPAANGRLKAVAEENGIGFIDIYTPLSRNRSFLKGNSITPKGMMMLGRVFDPAGFPEAITAVRDTAYTGRGNTGERLTTLTISLRKPVAIRRMKVALSAEEGDVQRISIVSDGKVLGKAKVRKGKRNYSIPCFASISDMEDIDVCADISEDAVEGNTVSADILRVKVNRSWHDIEVPAPGCREILLRRTEVLGPGMYGSVGYRIPAILCLPDGTLLITTDKRKYNDLDLPEDIDIVAQRSTDGGISWSEPVTVIEGQGFNKGYGDAALELTASGDVLCAFSGGVGLWASTLDNPQRNYISRSRDGGLSWEEPFDCTSMLWGPEAVNPECKEGHSAFFGSGHGLRLTRGEHAGRVLFVAAVHFQSPWRFNNYAFYTDDEGRSWHVSECAFVGGDEAKVVELPDGRVMMSVRRSGERGFNISEDGGHSWGEQGLWKDICVNACDGDIISVGDSLLLQSVPNDMSRRNVSVFVSRDGALSWPYAKSLCRYESVYSSMTLLPDGTIGAYIEENPDVDFRMYYLNFSIDWLLRGEK